MKPAAELSEANDNRRNLYSFLARVYAKEVDVEFLRGLKGKREFFLASAHDPEVEGTELADGFRELAEYVGTLRDDELEKARLELAVEYAGVFLGAWKGVAHPSESAYETEGRLIMQKPRDEVLAEFRSMGLQKSEDFAEPEDHIALELQFMAHMSEKTGSALTVGKYADARKYLEIQKGFLEGHLVWWVPKLTVDIIKVARQGFYKAIAKITNGYIHIDKSILNELLDGLALAETEPEHR
jgi:TorA maturation chaperone TorD